MPPGTYHAVFSLQSSISTGGGVCLKNSYSRVLETAIREHHYGQLVSNEIYTDSHLLFFHLLKLYLVTIGDGAAKCKSL
jgi:hypothetical protein